MNKQLKFWRLATMLFIGSFATGAYATTFNVNANVNSVSGGVGLNTGITVTPGKLLVISADKQDTWSLGSGTRTGNANGLGNPFGGNFGNFTKPLTNFSFLFGTLVGSLDNGLTFFPIGTRMEQSIVKSGGGTLRLYAWDANSADNSGSIAVNVEVYSGP
ncbi:putative PEP motif anchor domain protein [Crenothrix polyspora]|uniref:Putative PEP motif anchor domain protein n=1 Tax=Crenothrix polyspora TaxID=360316 RepID=A0A1R4HEX3_9GAMM|nr:hypothetical protein [Crenothrix polyspora]SJM94774.1 putative PEP motif anchor domain protein [Crenothrix polyspora]